MILGTPRRKDWAQNLRSLRLNLRASEGVDISAEVLSSTQVGRVAGSGEVVVGLESHTVRLKLVGGFEGDRVRQCQRVGRRAG
jgi:hypothetical protein